MPIDCYGWSSPRETRRTFNPRNRAERRATARRARISRKRNR